MTDPTLPTDSAKLLKLAERCEAATGPDRELDFAIATAFGDMTQGQIDAYREVEGIYHFPEVSSEVEAPAYYTASLDAAMSLVPEGWGYCIEQERPTRSCEVSLSAPGGEPWGPGANNAEGNTPALALCAAALRAIAAQGGTHAE